MDFNLIKADSTYMEIIEENSINESDVNIKIHIIHNEHNEMLPIDHHQIEFKNEAENLVSHEEACFEYDGASFMHNSAPITDIQIHNEIPYNCLENKFYPKEAYSLMDHELIRERVESYKHLPSNSNMSSNKTTMSFDDETNLEFTDEIANDESDVDIKIDIHNQLLFNDSQQLVVKDKFKTEAESLHEEKCFTYDISLARNNTSITNVEMRTGEKPYKCLECDSGFRLKYYLNRHRLVHIGKKPYKCLECDSSFKQKAHLNTHKLTHTGIKPYKCLECDSSFKQKAHLNTHKLTHTGKKPYKCLECDSRFGRKETLKRHRLIHTGKKPYKCLECDSSFKQKSHLNSHELIHTGKKPYKCVECDSSFRWKSDLNKHKLIHTDKKPYKCLECDSSFKRKSHLNRHNLIHTSENRYKCLQCNSSFRIKPSLTKHMYIHNRDIRYSCFECGAKFNRKSYIKKHVFIHIGI